MWVLLVGDDDTAHALRATVRVECEICGSGQWQSLVHGSSIRQDTRAIAHDTCREWMIASRPFSIRTSPKSHATPTANQLRPFSRSRSHRGPYPLSCPLVTKGASRKRLYSICVLSCMLAPFLIVWTTRPRGFDRQPSSCFWYHLDVFCGYVAAIHLGPHPFRMHGQESIRHFN